MVNRILSLPERGSFFLFGPRQSGKSTLIESRYTQSVWKIDLLLTDVFLTYSRDPARFRQEAIEKVKKENIKTIFIDEVQRLPSLLNEIQFLLQNLNCQFIITGSSARKLKRGGANLLAGRVVERHLFPFVYEEIKDCFRLEEAIRFGTLPPLTDKSEEEKRDILSTYVHTYLKEEIQSEGIARNIGGFSRFLDMSAAQFGELVSFSNIGRECQLPTRTVQSYYEILEDTLIGFRLQPWRRSLRKRISAHPKFYFFDNGITNAINKHLTNTLDSSLKGRLFEQWIILEADRMIQYHRSEANLFYWRTNHGAEVDLLIEKHGRLNAAFEIKFTPHIAGSHFSGLRSFRQENDGVPCFVVCTAQHAYERDNIKILPWKDFLTQLPAFI